jgi:hypothetical protein
MILPACQIEDWRQKAAIAGGRRKCIESETFAKHHLVSVGGCLQLNSNA